MAIRLVNVDRDTPMMLPPDLRDWVAEDHIVHLILDAVDRLPHSRYHYNWRGGGSEQYPPAMMFALLAYCYSTGRFSSRRIEEATYSDVAVRYVTGNTHPDHDTICTFRRQNAELFKAAFVDILLMASNIAGVKKVGTVAVDGSKVQANASKHAAVSYERAGKQIAFLQEEVARLVAKAEDADSTPLDDGLSVPKEIERREDRIRSLQEARRIIEERYEPELARQQAQYEERKANREAQRQAGKKPRGKEPKPPSAEPPAKKQYNFTDAESRLMKSGGDFVQAYNAQAAVDTQSRFVVGARVTNEPNDRQELAADVASIPDDCGKPESVLVDKGFHNEKEIETVEADGGPVVYVAVDKDKHGYRVSDLEVCTDPPPPGEDASTTEKMRHRMSTKAGKQIYKLRKQTVEPIFGIIKEAMGFRRFSRRGLDAADAEWSLVCTAYNLRRLFAILQQKNCAQRLAESAILS